MKRVRARLSAIALATCLGASVVAAAGTPAQALSNPAIPVLTFERTITSHPFTGAPGNAIDLEGLGYVAGDNSMWLADDNGDRVWEIDPTTGAYKSQLRGGNPSNPANVDFTTATQVGTGRTCGDPALVDPTFLDVTGTTQVDTSAYECLSRTDDFESAVFDPGPTAATSDDALYVTSGNCCTAGFPDVYVDNDNNPLTPPTQSSYPFHPTVWKLTRDGLGDFKPAQWQALPEGTDPTAAGLRPGGSLYFGHSKSVQTYTFATNTLGSTFTLPVPNATSDIVGITFTDAITAFVTTATPNTASNRTTATSDSTIQRFDISGPTWTPNAAWKFPLASIGTPGGPVDDDGMIDARDLAIVSSGGVDRFYVSDGYDFRASNDHPIYVYTLGSAPAPTASFTAVPTTGLAPFNVQFTDTSTPLAPAAGAPTSWDWNFGDGTAHSTLQSPLHTYTAAGTYTATLTASNASGPSALATQTITVTPAPPLPPGWETLGGTMTSGPASSTWGVNRVDTFARGGDGQLWHRTFAGQWYAWEPLGAPSGGFTGDPAAVSWSPGRVDVFVRGNNDHLWHKVYAGQWYGWEDLGGTLASSPTVSSMMVNRLDVFAKATDNQLQHKYWNVNSWSSWEKLGGVLTADPGAVSWGPNRIDVFARSSDNQLWHKFFGGSAWSAWEPLGGGLGSGPGVSSWGPGRLDVFVVGSTGGIWHRWFDGTAWRGWEPLGGSSTADPDATSWSVGRVDVFVRGGDNSLWHRALI